MIDRYPGRRLCLPARCWKFPSSICFSPFSPPRILIALLARFLPQTSIYRRFILSTTNPPGPSLAGVPRSFATALPLAPGMQGRALTILRPSGKAEFESHIVDVVTEGEFVAPQTPVAIVSTDGMRVVVKGVAV